MYGWTVERAPTGLTWARDCDRCATWHCRHHVILVSVGASAKDEEVTVDMAKIKKDSKKGDGHDGGGCGAAVEHAIHRRRGHLFAIAGEPWEGGIDHRATFVVYSD